MQQAIDILDEMISEYDHKMYLAFCGNPAIEIDKEAKSKLIEAKSRIQALGDGWISVSDRLPEDNKYVLTCGHDYHEVGFHKGDGIFDDGDYYDHYEPTHWMPLPKIPK